MIELLSDLASLRARRVLLLAAGAFVLAAVVGVPVLSQLKSQSSDFQDPNAPNQRALRAIEAATGQTADYGVAVLVPTARKAAAARASTSRGGPLPRPGEAGAAARVAALLSAQRGFERVLDYPASRSTALVSRNGRQTVVLAAFSTRDQAAAAVERVCVQLWGSGVRFGGNDVTFHEINKRTTSDLQRAESLAFPILLLLSF